MKRRKIFTAVSSILFVGFMAMTAFAAVRLDSVPTELYLAEGGTRTVNFGLPISIKITASGDENAVSAMRFNGNTLGENDTFLLNEPIHITSEAEKADVSVSLSLWGAVSLKNIDIKVGEQKMLYPGGQSIGVLLYSDGALVVGNSFIETEVGEKISPAEQAGIMAGDIITKVNGIEVENAAHLSEIVNGLDGQSFEVCVDRNGKSQDVTVYPAKDAADHIYKLGVWVRDSTAGVGTLTFWDAEENKLAGLGHAITDVDTGKTVSVKNGEIIDSHIIEVVKGTSGSPGELKGVFNLQTDILGCIEKNTPYGIYGDGDASVLQEMFSEAIPAAGRDETQLGDAHILCEVNDEGVKQYECKITKIARQYMSSQKSFVVEITDEALLEITGGIVQGMSGSPVIQNGKLVGAVTHVFVDDPTKGYGIYTDWMLEEVQSVSG